MAVNKELIDQATILAARFVKTDRRHDLFDITVDLANQLAIHYEFGTEPGDIIHAARPHEPDLIYKYRISSHEQTTYSYAEKILNVIKGAIFNKELMGIEYPADPPPVIEDDPIQGYLMDIPFVGDHAEFITDSLLVSMIADPNGYLVLLPAVDDQEIRPDQMREPFPEFIPSANIIDAGKWHLLAESSEKNEAVRYRREGGYVLYLFTPDATLKLIEAARGSVKTPVFDIEVIHDHNMYSAYNTLAWVKMKGRVSGNKKSVLEQKPQTYNLSFLQGTVPHFNLALKTLTDVATSITNHLHPQKWEVRQDCDNPSCNGGYVYSEGAAEKHACVTCQGTGKITSATSPFISYEVVPGDDGKIQEPAGYIVPSYQVVQYAEQWYFKHLAEAMSAANMEMLNAEQSRANATAESKVLDREQLHHFLRVVSGGIYPLWQWMLDGINYMRYGALLNFEQLEANKVVLLPPRSFDTINANEGIERIKAGIEASLPKSYLLRLALDNVGREYRADSMKNKILKSALMLDPLPFYTEEEILAANAAGASISEQDIRLHFNMIPLLNAAIAEDEEFLLLEYPEQREKMLSLLPKIEKAPPVVQEARFF